MNVFVEFHRWRGFARVVIPRLLAAVELGLVTIGYMPGGFGRVAETLDMLRTTLRRFDVAQPPSSSDGLEHGDVL